MPSALPDRYELRVRLGRDQDVEEWLGTDVVLDRAVLVRILDPGATEERSRSFLAAVRGAASVTHTHLTAVFAAAPLENGAYMIGEWAGGVSLADRLEAGETLPAHEFLPNAAGLAGALAALHDTGVVHGAIDLATVSYTHAHPAKLGGFGRIRRSEDPLDDVRSLAEVLERAVTGSPPGGALPSQVADGLPGTVDETLEAARRRELAAGDLAARLRAIPSTPVQPQEPAWSWRWLVPASILLALAVAIASLGLILRAPQETSPFLYPVDPVATDPPPVTTTSTDTTVPGTPRLVEAFAYDPFGDGREHDDAVPRAVDGDPTTAWRTERYFDPLPLIKPGVGLGLAVEGTPEAIELVAIPGTAFTVLWAEQTPDRFEEWARIASGTTAAGPTRLQLPTRDGGVWLLWFENLPDRGDGFYTEVSEVRFLP